MRPWTCRTLPHASTPTPTGPAPNPHAGVFPLLGTGAAVYVYALILHGVSSFFVCIATPICKRATDYGLQNYSPFLTFIYFGVDMC